MKVTALQEAGAIGADGRAFNSALAVLGGFGAFFATVANVVFGRISDRTTGKWGRRRPWILVGTAIMTVGLAVMASGPTLMMATVGWSIAQLGANMALAPFIATIADQVPKFQRGKITALLGIAQNAGIVGGVYVASWFGSSLILMFVLPAVVAIVVAIVLPRAPRPGPARQAAAHDAARLGGDVLGEPGEVPRLLVRLVVALPGSPSRASASPPSASRTWATTSASRAPTSRP